MNQPEGTGAIHRDPAGCGPRDGAVPRVPLRSTRGDFHLVPPGRAPAFSEWKSRLLRALFQDLVGEIVVYLGIVVQGLEVGVSE